MYASQHRCFVCILDEREGTMTQQRLVQLSLAGTILLSLLIGVYLFASRRLPRRGSNRKVVQHTVEKKPDEVLKYWTADKMRNAKPAEMPRVDAHD